MSDETNVPPSDLSHAGAVVDKAIEYMMGQNISAVAIASALLGGSMALLSRSMADDAIIGILNNAIASIRSGELHEQLIVPLLRNARFRHAELVDAAFDRLTRLHDRFIAQLQLDVRLHRERVAAVHVRAAVEVRLHFVRSRAEIGVHCLRYAVDLELRRAEAVDRGERDALRLKLLTEPLHLRFRFQPQRIVGLDAEDEMDAAFEIEPELQLLVHQPAGRREVVLRGGDRVDADHPEQDQDGDDGEDFPAKIRHQFDPSAVTTGSLQSLSQTS